MRMLGDGRPFVLEMHNARNPHPDQAALDAAAAALAAAGAGVQARGLRLVGREALVRLKAHHMPPESMHILCFAQCDGI